MVRTIVIGIVSALVMGCFTGCSKYTSSWNASCFVHSNTSGNAYMDFGTFSGTMVNTLKCEDASKETLKYTGSLESGKLIVYYDDDGTKKELFTLKEGEEVTSTVEKLHEGTVYIIVETEGKCENGELEFDIE